MRLIDFFDRGLRHHPDRACLIDADGESSYRAVAERSHRTANALIADGLRPGDRVAVLSPNAARAFEAWIGAARAGGVWVGLAALASVDETIYILNQRQAGWLFYHSDFAAWLPRIRAECPTLRRLVCLDREGDGAPSFERFIEGHGSTAPALPDERDAVISHFTSGGTTGRPKGAMWSNLVWEAWSANLYAHLPIRKPPVHLVATAMAHGAAVWAWPAMAFGGTTVCLPKADPLVVMEAIDRHGVTQTFMPPTVIYMILAHPGARAFDYSTLDYFVYGGAPMSADKVAEAIDLFGPCMTQIYGQAECPCTIGILTPADHLEALADPAKAHRLLSCGRPPVFVQVEMMDDDGALLPPGEWGEIVVRGTFVSLGYHDDPEATAVIRAHGWHHTGDIGYKDDDGFVYIVDRKKDMIISGGLNVFPIEIERVVWGHPAVQDCAVIGVPDEKWGEAVKAVVELKPGESVSEAEIVALCKRELAGYKAPKTVEFWDELPRSGVGKVLKREVRARFWEGRARKI